MKRYEGLVLLEIGKYGDTVYILPTEVNKITIQLTCHLAIPIIPILSEINSNR